MILFQGDHLFWEPFVRLIQSHYPAIGRPNNRRYTISSVNGKNPATMCSRNPGTSVGMCLSVDIHTHICIMLYTVIYIYMVQFKIGYTDTLIISKNRHANQICAPQVLIIYIYMCVKIYIIIIIILYIAYVYSIRLLYACAFQSRSMIFSPFPGSGQLCQASG